MSAQPTGPTGGCSDEAAFCAFYRTGVPRLVAFLLWSGASLSDATDLVQDAMCRVYERWDDVEFPLAWCRTVVHHDWVHRTTRRREEPVAELPAPSPLLRTVEGAEDWVQQQEVLRLLARLPERQRQVIACAVDGLTPSQTAELLGLQHDAVRANLYKARRALAVHWRAVTTEED